jgi:hypothetical protein
MHFTQRCAQNPATRGVHMNTHLSVAVLLQVLSNQNTILTSENCYDGKDNDGNGLTDAQARAGRVVCRGGGWLALVRPSSSTICN